METSQAGSIWRASASLIIAANNSENKTNDYNLLLLKRSQRTSKVPNQAVFPGGVLDKADESVDWIKYFHEFGVTYAYLKILLVNEDNRPKILTAQCNGYYDEFFKRDNIWARDISLRLTALRETFEEVGILLCRTSQQLKKANAGFGYYLDDFDKAYWQQAVHNDSKQFLELCKKLQVVPDLWSLREWSVWATPASVRKCYETVFYIVCLNRKPAVMAEQGEVEELMWNSPKEIYEKSQNDKVYLLTPQFYEILRLLGVQTMNELKTFSHAREICGTTLYLPVAYQCNDGLVFVLPGDDFYVMEPRSANIFFNLDLSMTAFRKIAKKVHRCEKVGTPNIKVYLNFEPLDGHLVPGNLSNNSSKL